MAAVTVSMGLLAGEDMAVTTDIMDEIDGRMIAHITMPHHID